MPLGTLEFYAADWNAEAIASFCVGYNALMTVKSVKAQWTSVHDDVESREIVDELVKLTGWARGLDSDTQDDTVSMVFIEVDATEMTIRELNEFVACISSPS